MKKTVTCLLPVFMAIGIAVLGSCSNSSKTETKSQDSSLTDMDSVSTALKAENEKLEDHAKKVEESLAKADKEFNQAK